MRNFTNKDAAIYMEPIRQALSRYSEVTDGRVEFDRDLSCQLELTPGRPNAARSKSIVRYLGESAAMLFVIAFSMEDGTGDEACYKLKDHLIGGLYPRIPRIVPKPKSSVLSEAHLTLASAPPFDLNVDPVLFAGHLDLIGLKHREIRRLSFLGQDGQDFAEALSGKITAEPTVTLTLGTDNLSGERFGDPHAVFNAGCSYNQVCGFIAITNESSPRNQGILDELGAVKPKLRF